MSWKALSSLSSEGKAEQEVPAFGTGAKGVSHTFGNPGDSPARLLIIHSPAADACFAELEGLWKDSTPTGEAPDTHVDAQFDHRYVRACRLFSASLSRESSKNK